MPKDVSFFRFIPFLKNVALKEGTIVIETSNDANKLNAIASANGLNISPTEPVTNANGRNTIIVTIVEDMIGLKTSFVALMISLSPVNASFLSDNRLYMFSTTTIESSITRPIATVSAPSVKMFNETLANFSATIAISIDIGMETTEIAVVLMFLKNNKMTIIATIVPSAAFSIIVYSESSIGLAVSITFVAFISLFSFVNSSMAFLVSFASLEVITFWAFVICTFIEA